MATQAPHGGSVRVLVNTRCCQALDSPRMLVEDSSHQQAGLREAGRAE